MSLFCFLRHDQNKPADGLKFVEEEEALISVEGTMSHVSDMTFISLHQYHKHEPLHTGNANYTHKLIIIINNTEVECN